MVNRSDYRFLLVCLCGLTCVPVFRSAAAHLDSAFSKRFQRRVTIREFSSIRD